MYVGQSDSSVHRSHGVIISVTGAGKRRGALHTVGWEGGGEGILGERVILRQRL